MLKSTGEGVCEHVIILHSNIVMDGAVASELRVY